MSKEIIEFVIPVDLCGYIMSDGLAAPHLVEAFAQLVADNLQGLTGHWDMDRDQDGFPTKYHDLINYGILPTTCYDMWFVVME